MKRTAEPELMDDKEQAEAYAAADWSQSHGRIPGYFRERFPHFTSGRVVDLGCGPADVTIRFVRAFPGVTVLGVDGSEAMLALGKRLVDEAGLSSRIALENRFLPDPTLETRAFDGVICNSLLHHFADPIALWRTTALCVKAGGPIMLVDLVRPPDHERAVELVEEHAKDAPPVLRRDFLASLHAAYTPDEVRTQVEIAGLNGFRIDQVDELHLVAWGFAK
jgi:SAM-dependent methyltransferase